MEVYVYWFLLALFLLALEIASGTFYLLVVAVALSVGGLAALLGLTLAWQLVLSAAAAVAGSILLLNWKSSRAASPDETSLDVGQPVQVLSWRENGTARVLYRGAEWDAEPAAADMPHGSALYIESVRGAKLVLTHRKPGKP